MPPALPACMKGTSVEGGRGASPHLMFDHLSPVTAPAAPLICQTKTMAGHPTLTIISHLPPPRLLPCPLLALDRSG